MEASEVLQWAFLVLLHSKFFWSLQLRCTDLNQKFHLPKVLVSRAFSVLEGPGTYSGICDMNSPGLWMSKISYLNQAHTTSKGYERCSPLLPLSIGLFLGGFYSNHSRSITDNRPIQPDLVDFKHWSLINFYFRKNQFWEEMGDYVNCTLLPSTITNKISRNSVIAQFSRYYLIYVDAKQ